MRAPSKVLAVPGCRVGLLLSALACLYLFGGPAAHGQQVKVQIKSEKPVEGEEVEATGPVDPTPAINASFAGAMAYGLAVGQQRLTFSTGSARTSLHIDGQVVIPNAAQTELPPDKKGKPRNGVQSVFSNGKVTVTQIMEVVPGKSSDKPPPGEKRKMNTLLVRYVIENKDTAEHKVGVRMRIDTYCGGNDGCLFASPKTHPNKILDGIELKGKDVPEYVKILEVPDLKNPGFTGHFTFRMGSKYEPPSRVVFTYHGANEDGWNIAVQQAMGDSAAAFFWDPRPIPAGAKREFAFAHGVGIATTVASEGNVHLTFGGNFEPGKRFTIAARVEDAAAGQALTLELPQGMERVAGAETQPVMPGADGNGMALWTARVATAGTYTLRVRSDRGAVHTRVITITPMPGQ